MKVLPVMTEIIAQLVIAVRLKVYASAVSWTAAVWMMLATWESVILTPILQAVNWIVPIKTTLPAVTGFSVTAMIAVSPEHASSQMAIPAPTTACSVLAAKAVTR